MSENVEQSLTYQQIAGQGIKSKADLRAWCRAVRASYHTNRQGRVLFYAPNANGDTHEQIRLSEAAQRLADLGGFDISRELASIAGDPAKSKELFQESIIRVEEWCNKSQAADHGISDPIIFGTVTEIATYVGVNARTITNWFKGKLPKIVVDGKYICSKSTLQMYKEAKAQS